MSKSMSRTFIPIQNLILLVLIRKTSQPSKRFRLSVKFIFMDIYIYIAISCPNIRKDITSIIIQTELGAI